VNKDIVIHHRGRRNIYMQYTKFATTTKKLHWRQVVLRPGIKDSEKGNSSCP
jgi:hypothetical protein